MYEGDQDILTEKSQVEHRANKEGLAPESIDKQIPFQAPDEEHINPLNLFNILSEEVLSNFSPRIIETILQKVEITLGRVFFTPLCWIWVINKQIA